ncbi:hypothetical protein SBOR_6977 [Sclerotinia borealis F-4128]|uniref:AMP-activated protein kinase glycogen-binding domain-containing protein n=1 Tax=Sclerotinia borealis (strain F-4128) TaxID=1432307 RepID=W9CA15_SCLBF|nr:hypothetical protein SBOR_6977 [Sclerotinia borealis F-4128]
MADQKTSVVIKYSKPGTAPPIYLAGSFPDSPWQPQEMEYTNDSVDRYIFSKEVEVEEGKEYQYKFRLGDGEWWMSDEDAPTVTDEVGNQNNLLTVPIKSSSQSKSTLRTESPSNQQSLEESSTPRTIPDLDTKETTMETPIEPTQHAGDEVLRSSHPEASALVTDSTSNHSAEAIPEKTQETHDTSPSVAEADHAIESGKETPAEQFELSSIPVEELEVSSTGVEEPDHLESHAHLEAAEKLKSTTTEILDLKPNSSTEEVSEIPKESLDNETDTVEPEEATNQDPDEVLQTKISMNEDEAVKQQDDVSIASEKSELDKEPLISEREGIEETDTHKDDSIEHREEDVPTPVESKQQLSASETKAKEETDTSEDEVSKHQEEPAHIATEESKSKLASESETKEEAAITHTKEPSSIQETLHSEDRAETKEEPVPSHIEDPRSVQEPLVSEGKAKEETDLADSRAISEEKLVEELETSKSQNSGIPTSNPILAYESTENVAEEPEKEEIKSSEVTTSNPVSTEESIGNAAEDTNSAEQTVVTETGTTPGQEQAVLEPIQVEEPVKPSTNETVLHEDKRSKAIDVEEIPTIETPADDTDKVPEPNNVVNPTRQESTAQDVVEHDEVNKPVESTTNITKGDDKPSTPTEVVSAPLVTIEKVDSEPRHGDDFGSDATFAQKDARTLHAQDAVPDQITIRQQTATPELANVAAEVADSAALLDEAPPTPPMSDREAGKIGYRRLSQTPIPEVAETAAEVADTAAQIDKNFKQPAVIELPTPHRDILSRGFDLDRDLDVETPFEERAPLFAHECSRPPTAEERREYESAQSRSAVAQPMFREFDPNDPSLEPFPSNFNQILEHVRRLENQLSEDQTDVERNSPSPVITNGNHHAESTDLPTPSPQSLAHETSPSLLPIVEENAEGEPDSKLTALTPSIEKSQSDGNISDSPKKGSGDQKTEINNAENSERTSRDSSQIPTMKFAQASSKLHPVLPALPPTPFVENKSLTLTGSAQNSPPEPGKNSPAITVQPATPAASVNAKVNDSISKENAAKTTSFAEEIDDAQLRARKQPTSNVPERSITPSSMRSAGNDAKSRNFLRAFFQVVFVDWIGGLIRKLCGGGRHTLLAVPALLIVVAAPILYLSGLANFVFGLT